ncbi:MAG: hypothetical protein ACE5KA_09315 [Nitrososphaerales archaeon]
MSYGLGYFKVMGTKSTTDFGELLSNYGELIVTLKSRFPNTDVKFLFELMSHEFLNADHTPTVQLEIFYKPGVDLRIKSEHLSKRTDRVPALDESERRLVVEPRLKLPDIEELAQDRDIESLAGDMLCCTDTLLSRRKKMV